MANYYVFRVKGSTNDGLRIQSGLYDAILATTSEFARRKFPHLLEKNDYKNKFINENQLEEFREELEEAGKIILENPLVQYALDNKKEEITALENIFTNTRAAINIATLMELCDRCIKHNNPMIISIENAKPEHERLSLEKKLSEMEYKYGYELGATSVRDYQELKK